jgi:hypothetical protein
VTSTLPLGNKVAVCTLPFVTLPVAVNVPEAGSYNSALDKKPKPLKPPVTKTLPLGNKVAVCDLRLVAMLPVKVNPSSANAIPGTAKRANKAIEAIRTVLLLIPLAPLI